MLISLAILLVICGAVLAQISNMQARYHTEEARLNTVEEGREFVDQMVRDLHQTAFPHKRMFTASFTGAQPYSNSAVAAGLVLAMPTEIRFEADLDGSGQVQEVQYQLTKNGSLVTDLSQCPCTLQRGQWPKANNTKPEAQPIQAGMFTTQVDNVINPVASPPFRYFGVNGDEITGLPLQFDSTQTNGGEIAKIYTVQLSVTIAGQYADVTTHQKPEVTYTATAQMNN
jgi:type II secretory pathway component PulJ